MSKSRWRPTGSKKSRGLKEMMVTLNAANDPNKGTYSDFEDAPPANRAQRRFLAKSGKDYQANRRREKAAIR